MILSAFQDPLGQLPPPASTFAADVDGLFYFCFWVSVASFLLIAGLLIYSAIAHRRKHPDQGPISNFSHNTMLEVVWTLVPTVILMVIFAWGWKGNLDQSIAPANALQYRVQGQKWAWNFWHPGSLTPVAEMWVPINTPVKITTDSKDVLHSFYIPAFRCKRDVLPGRYQIVWFEATQLGDFPIFCSEYCGDGHSQMGSMVHVVTQEEYDERPWDIRPEDPVKWGEQLFQANCATCHLPTAATLIGPGMENLYGREEEMSDGSKVVVDDEYILESIRYPQKRIVKGYEGQIMTAFGEALLPDQPDPGEEHSHISALIEYIKSLKKE